MPDAKTAFVASSNFDQRFDAGWLTRIDLDLLRSQLESGASLGRALRRELKVPSLAGDLVTLPAARRAYLSHRGSGVMTALDYADAGGSHLHCGTPGGASTFGGYLSRTDCDEAHLFDLKRELAERDGIWHSPRREQLNDPLALVQVSDAEALVAFLGDERIVSFAPGSGGSPELSTLERRGPGRARYSALARLRDGGVIACGHASEGPFAGEEALLSLFPAATPTAGRHLFLSRELADGRSLDRAAGHVARVLEAEDGRLFVLTRGPEAILVLEPSAAASVRLDEAEAAAAADGTSFPYVLAEAYPIAGVRLTDAQLVPHDGGELLVVTSLERDALYVFDVASSSRLHLAARLRIAGRGPSRLLYVPGSRPLLLVSTFYDHGLTVVDLSPNNPTDFVATSFADASNPSHLPRP